MDKHSKIHVIQFGDIVKGSTSKERAALDLIKQFLQIQKLEDKFVYARSMVEWRDQVNTFSEFYSIE